MVRGIQEQQSSPTPMTVYMTKDKSPAASAPNVKRVARKSGKWAEHVRQYRELHKVSFKDALKGAGASYVKLVRTKKEKKDYKENPWMAHINAWKASNPDWKSSISYKDVLKTCKETYKPSKVIVKSEPLE